MANIARFHEGVGAWELVGRNFDDLAIRRSAHGGTCVVAYVDGEAWHYDEWSGRFASPCHCDDGDVLDCEGMLTVSDGQAVRAAAEAGAERIVVGAEGGIWAVTADGMLRWNGERFIATSCLGAGAPCGAVLAAPDGEMWAMFEPAREPAMA